MDNNQNAIKKNELQKKKTSGYKYKPRKKKIS